VSSVGHGASGTVLVGAKRPPGLQYGSGGPGTDSRQARGRCIAQRDSTCAQFRKFVCIKLNSVGNPASQAARGKTSAVFNFIQIHSRHERRLLSIRVATARRSDAFQLLLFGPASKKRRFGLAPGKSAGRGMLCSLSNRPARLPRKCCVRYAVAVCVSPSLNRITTANASTTTALPAASAMKLRRMFSTVPRRLASAPVVKVHYAHRAGRQSFITLLGAGCGAGKKEDKA
jgi:hypothetical protein